VAGAEAAARFSALARFLIADHIAIRNSSLGFCMASDVLFKPFDLKGLKLPNRVVMAPMTRVRAGSSGVPGDAGGTGPDPGQRCHDDAVGKLDLPQRDGGEK